MDDDVRIWFNPTCSKCRGALEILHDRGVEAEVVEYLVTPPTADEIRDVLAMLGMQPRELMRRGEPVYKQLDLAHASDDELIDAMVANPILIERPVVISGGRAVIGRPPENIVELFRPN